MRAFQDWALSCKLVTAPENATHVVVARRTEKWLKALALQEAGHVSSGVGCLGCWNVDASLNLVRDAPL